MDGKDYGFGNWFFGIWYVVVFFFLFLYLMEIASTSGMDGSYWACVMNVHVCAYTAFGNFSWGVTVSSSSFIWSFSFVSLVDLCSLSSSAFIASAVVYTLICDFLDSLTSLNWPHTRLMS